MISVTCTMCQKELKQPGALVFSSPDENGSVIKHHICVNCEVNIVVFMTPGISGGKKRPLNNKVEG